jgi:Family of unknown function (DUF6588)
MLRRVLRPLGGAVLALLVAAPATAQVEEALSAYTGANAEGYMQPIANALGANLNDAFFYSAYIPKSGARFSFEVAVMSVIFSDGEKTFQATTEGGFMPTQTVTAPTIIGSTDPVTVSGTGGTTFTFPGGFDLSSLALAVPQLRIGAIKGTEALVRFFAADISDNEISNIDLFGIGVRHSVSQYFNSPVALALGAMWQTFSLGGDFVDTSAFTIGLQASKHFSLLEPYGGLSYDYFKMDVTYESDVNSEDITVNFDAITSARLTLGLGLNYKIGHAFAEYDIASTNSFAFGLTLGK